MMRLTSKTARSRVFRSPARPLPPDDGAAGAPAGPANAPGPAGDPPGDVIDFLHSCWLNRAPRYPHTTIPGVLGSVDVPRSLARRYRPDLRLDDARQVGRHARGPHRADGHVTGRRRRLEHLPVA